MPVATAVANPNTRCAANVYSIQMPIERFEAMVYEWYQLIKT